MAKWDFKDLMPGPSIGFDEYQTWALTTAIYPKAEGLTYTALGLAGEAGEYAGKISKYIRDGELDDKAAAKELSDILWFVAVAASELGYDLTEIVAMNVDKLNSRKERGTIGGSGDSR
jgi:NTP pyrophosphatase (non-canonical NTP hydrolase)